MEGVGVMVLADEGFKAFKNFYDMGVGEMKSYNWKQARTLCNLLEKEVVSVANRETVGEYLDFKETMYLQAPLYGCEIEEDKA